MRNNTEALSTQVWIKFNEADPHHKPFIEEFGRMMDAKFPGGFYDDYCYNRGKIGKLPFRRKNGIYEGVEDTFRTERGAEYRAVRMPHKFLEEESMWWAWMSIRGRVMPQKNREASELPF